mgnify:CR=1 FL=1
MTTSAAQSRNATAEGQPTEREPIKVLHVIPWIASGGVEQRRLELARRLDANQFEQRIACQGAPSPLADRIREAGVEVEVLGEHSRRWELRNIYQIVRLIRQWRPDIVHGAVFEGVALATIAGRLAGSEIIIAEEIDFPADRSWKGILAFKAFSMMADRCVAVSPSVVDYLTGPGLVPSDRVTRIFNGTSPPRKPSNDQLEQARQKLGIPRDAFVIGGVGRIRDHHKRFSDLLRAAAAVAPDIPSLHVLVVGDGPDLDMLRELAKKLGIADRVSFAGYRTDVGTMYALMDVFVLSSNRESFGLVLVEAMFSGLPVVSTRVGGPRDIVIEGETGLFVPPYKPDAIARTVETLYNDPDLRQRLAEAGRRRAEEQFSSERYAEDVRRLYIELAARPDLAHN